MNGIVSTQTLEQRVGQELREIGIPPCPEIMLRIQRATQLPEPDFTELATIIGDDVALSAGLIKVANSPYFGFQKRVRSVSEAMLVIGLKTIMHAIAGLQLQKTFEHIPRMERYWHSSAQTAHTAAWLTHRLRDCQVRPADAYTYGLFHNCGVPVLIAPFKNYLTILQQANTEAERSFTALEDQHFGVNHAGVGADMAREWLLPEEIWIGIRHHHDRDAIAGLVTEVPESSRRLIALTHLADHCNHAHTGLNFTREWEKLGDVCLDVLHLDTARCEAVVAESASALQAE